MTDIFSRDKRKAIMSSVRSKNTVPEVAVFNYLNKQKIYYQKHYGRITGKPDIALPRSKKAVFVDGDYWHGRYPDKVTKSSFWKNKIKSNIERDKLVNTELANKGWLVLRVWASDINRKSTQQNIFDRIVDFLKNE
jgi:DNA mismatch endonuclease (patch repair protein)